MTFEDGLDVAFPNIGADPFEITWQTKSLTRHQPMLENYKVTSAGRLLKEDAEYEHAPEEDRPGYNEETDGFDTEIERARGSMRKIHHGWSDTAYHGTFEFHRTIDGDYVSLDAKFTDGQLVEISRNK
ncbi:hypothetical protein EXE46_08845 [Halorubrum sp. GN11_10-6_MGM]|uniref:hypothetical protein n=1 Tax=Halorubrum sp. GN11_10-6_MGM TaxID=2518112 RepID=UPI0010F4666B|nr:hypothetical protein [Halorubrum sp. GN11_10-6_MGM]TKX74466.1 hypothetical protein EXE46_08845 [Halorubrum sp. GN11_10-6_MGM]